MKGEQEEDPEIVRTADRNHNSKSTDIFLSTISTPSTPDAEISPYTAAEEEVVHPPADAKLVDTPNPPSSLDDLLSSNEIWEEFVTDSFSKAVNYPLEDIISVVDRIITKMEIKTLETLEHTPTEVLILKGIPAGLSAEFHNHFNQKKALKDKTCQLERFFRTEGGSAGLSSDDIDIVVTELVHCNWIKTINDAFCIDDKQWNSMNLPNGLAKKLRIMLNLLSSIPNPDVDSLQIGQILVWLSSHIGQSTGVLHNLAIKLADEHELVTLGDLRKLKISDLNSLDIPLSVQLELDCYRVAHTRTLKMAFRHLVPPPLPLNENDEDIHSDIDESIPTTYQEINVKDFLRAVTSQCECEGLYDLINRLFTEIHWISQLETLRRLNDRAWLAIFGYCDTLTEKLKSALTDPVILNMNAVYRGEIEPLRFPCGSDVAVESLYVELEEADRKGVGLTFMRLFEFLLSAPTDPSKRIALKANPNFLAAAKYASTHAVFVSLGYKDYGTCYLLPTLYLTRVKIAHKRLGDLLTQTLKPKKSRRKSMTLLRKKSSTSSASNFPGSWTNLPDKVLHSSHWFK